MDEQTKKILWIWETGSDASTNTSGKDANNVARTSALQLEEVRVRQFALGKSCAAIVSEDEKLYMMGRPGELPLTLSGIETTLQEVFLLKTHQVLEVACGYHHVAAVVQTGAVFCWGMSPSGQCGIVADCIEKPNRIEIISNQKIVSIKSVACGKHHTMALSTDMELWGWGAKHLIGSATPGLNTPCPHPEIVQHLCERKILQVSCGKSHTVVLTEKIKRSSRSEPDTIERCQVCNRDIYKWEDTELIMQDNGDQVVISDNHACAHRQMQTSNMMSSSSNISRVKTSSHVRSLSLPFLRKNSPMSTRRDQSEGMSKTPPLHLKIPMHSTSLKQKVLSESNLLEKRETHEESSLAEFKNPSSESSSKFNSPDKDSSYKEEEATKLEDPGERIQGNRKKDSSEALTEESSSLATSADDKLTLLLPKSASMPIDLWKKGQTEPSDPFLFNSKMTDDSSSFSCTPPGSSSASLASLDEVKSRMTLPTSTELEMNLDPESALNYLNRMTPDTMEEDIGPNVKNSSQHFPFESLNQSTENTEENQDGSSTTKRTISERITKSITDNQILSPITSYSKNMFTGVMDHIEWIKSSTYEKGVAPIRDLWSKAEKEKIEKNEEKENAEINQEDKSDDQTFYSPFHNPLQTELPQKSDDTLGKFQGGIVTLDTEVWTWGENKHGQLGLSDQLDRFQPTCVKSLSNHNITKVQCGANHTVALTSNSEVYTWGSNSHGQLGHQETTTRSPNMIECKHRIWDIAAGRYHTLVLTDGPSQKPNILVCGNDVTKDSGNVHPLQNNQKREKTSKDWKLRSVEFGHKMGFQSTVISNFSTLSSCLTEDHCSTTTVTMHEFAKSEREFNQLITTIKTQLFHPIQFSDLHKLLENTTYGELLSKTAELFGNLSHSIGLNTVSLSQAVISGNCHTDVFSYVGYSLMESFEKYFEALNNMIAYGFFERCETLSTKRSKFLSQPKLTELFKKLLSERRFSSTVSTENLLQLMLLPALRMREYANLMNKAAVSADEDVELGILLEKISAQWDTLWTKINNQTRSANNTRNFWKSEFKAGSGLKLAESLKKVGRHLVIHSKKVPLDVAHSGRFSYNWFILFTDCLTLVHYGTHVVYPLDILWCSPITEGKEASKGIKLVTPEDEIITMAGSEEFKSTWLNAFYRAINQIITKDKETQPDVSLHRSPSQNRHTSYTFLKEPELKGARYVGAWMNGKPHGKGKMTWEDGRCYKGSYKNGLENGFGEWKASAGDTLKLKYQGWWKDGKMDGYGKIWYSRFQTYEGHFMAGLREGHGILRTGSVTEGSVYVGGWKKDQRNGFGIEDNITKGEKYLGMWLNDLRHGVGILVTLDGLYGQSRFTNGEMLGDALLIEGRYVFEGKVAAGMILNGKGRLTLPTGDKFEGTFTGPWGENIRISGSLVRLDSGKQFHSQPESPKTPIDMNFTTHSTPQRDHAKGILRRYNRHIMKKLPDSKNSRSFPLSLHPDLKWTELFQHCCDLLGSPSEGSTESANTSKVWESVSVAISNARQSREIWQQTKTSPQKKIDERKLNRLEHIPSFVKLENDLAENDSDTQMCLREVKDVNEYLQQSFSTTLHPLGKLADSLGNVFRDSYSGAGAHKWLLTQAVADVRSFVRRTYDILRFMFPQLNKEYGSSHMKVLYPQNQNQEETLDSNCDEVFLQITAGDLLLPVLLPRVYPTLFTLYALRHETEDRTYWERVTRLNRHPDVALLSFLGVKPKFWLLDEKEIPALETSPEDGQLYENEEQAENSKWRHLLVARARDCSFLDAVETLQLISTTFIPAEKLNVIHSTFKEINATVMKHLKTKHTWSMDDLFPVFQYVVIRSRISHLGCEIQLVEDFLEADMCKGEKGIMFTTLKACYFQIRVEKDL